MYGGKKLVNRKNLIRALNKGDMEKFENTLISLFASVPYNNYIKNNISYYEGYYASVIYVYFMSLGIDLTAEDVTNKGRIDLTIKLSDKIYIIEFKMGKTNALQQIIKNKYFKSYTMMDLNLATNLSYLSLGAGMAFSKK